MSKFPKHLIKEIDELIRQADTAKASVLFARLRKHKPPRDLLVDVSRLARRIYSPMLGLKLLNPIVRPSEKVVVATDEEKGEYAACLTYVGASEEALDVLKTVDEKIPEVHLFRAFALFAQWDCGNAIPALERFLSFPQIENYQRLVGQVNLVMALIYERRHDEAACETTRLIEASKEHSLILGKAHYLAAQNAILQGKFSEAHESLSKAKPIFEKKDNLDSFFVKKWEAIARFSKNPNGETGQILEKVKEEARRREHWESIRDCDRFLAVILKDEKLMWNIYFGTPYQSLRKRLLQDFGADVAPSKYEWILGAGREIDSTLDLRLAKEHIAGIEFKPGQLKHRLLAALSRDFYRPAKIVILHHLLYPREYFNPVTSPARVHEAVRHLRRWLAHENIPLEIQEKHGFYSLSANHGKCISIIPPENDEVKAQAEIQKLKVSFGATPFNSKTVGECLGISRRTASRMLKELTESSKLEKRGGGSGTQYFLKAG